MEGTVAEEDVDPDGVVEGVVVDGVVVDGGVDGVDGVDVDVGGVVVGLLGCCAGGFTSKPL